MKTLLIILTIIICICCGKNDTRVEVNITGNQDHTFDVHVYGWEYGKDFLFGFNHGQIISHMSKYSVPKGKVNLIVANFKRQTRYNIALYDSLKSASNN